jgi:hypothetical protein
MLKFTNPAVSSLIWVVSVVVVPCFSGECLTVLEVGSDVSSQLRLPAVAVGQQLGLWVCVRACVSVCFCMCVFVCVYVSSRVRVCMCVSI